MTRAAGRTVFGIALGCTVGWLVWWIVDEPVRVRPADHTDAAAPRPERAAVRWSPAARELLEFRHEPAGQPSADDAGFDYRLHGSVAPPRTEGALIRVFPRDLDNEDSATAAIGPDGSFVVGLTERHHPPGELAFTKVTDGARVLFAGMVPLLSGLRIELWSELRVSGRVTVHFDRGSLDLPLPTNALEDLIRGELELFFEGADAGRVARTVPRDDGSFEIVLRPVTDSVPISIVSRGRRALLGRVVRSRSELRSPLEIELWPGTVAVECRSPSGQPVEGPVDWAAGWRPTPGDGPYLPIEPASVQPNRASFVASAGEIAGVASAPGHAPTPFRVAVSPGTVASVRLPMHRTEFVPAQVRLRDAAGRPTGGWVVVRIGGQPAGAPGAVLASSLADDRTGIADLELPSTQSVDVHCGLVETPSVGVLTSGWDPRDPLTVQLATPVRVEIVPRYLAGQPLCDGREPQWVLVPADGGGARSGVVAQARVPVDLLPGRYLVVVGGGDAGFAGVAHFDLQASREIQPLEVPMLPVVLARVRVDGGRGDGRVFVRIAGLDDSPLERLFAVSTRDGGTVELPVPDFERPIIRYEQADGSSAQVVWDGVRDIVLRPE